jgi:hypothetical protein
MRVHVVSVALDGTRAGRKRVLEARAARVEALRASAALAGAPAELPFEAWPHSSAGAPLPFAGWHASSADTRGLAVALVAPFAIGVDAEARARARWQAAREYFREAGELARLGSAEREDVLALWCAKEALLKLEGTGLAGLARVPLCASAREGERRYFRFQRAAHDAEVRVFTLAEHLVAVAGPTGLAAVFHVLQEAS